MALARYVRRARAGLLESTGTQALLAIHGLTNIASFPPATWGPHARAPTDQLSHNC
jgi:hypothetical protein